MENNKKYHNALLHYSYKEAKMKERKGKKIIGK